MAICYAPVERRILSSALSGDWAFAGPLGVLSEVMTENVSLTNIARPLG
jgi:hypothetical protein